MFFQQSHVCALLHRQLCNMVNNNIIISIIIIRNNKNIVNIHIIFNIIIVSSITIINTIINSIINNIKSEAW